MACCIIGSILFTLIIGASRWIQGKLLGKQPERPELWRLTDENSLSSHPIKR